MGREGRVGLVGRRAGKVVEQRSVSSESESEGGAGFLRVVAVDLRPLPRPVGVGRPRRAPEAFMRRKIVNVNTSDAIATR